MFFVLNGARICSWVGAALRCGLVVLEIFLMECLKKGFGCWRRDFAHEEHVQIASLRVIPPSRRGKVFILIMAANCCVTETCV